MRATLLAGTALVLAIPAASTARAQLPADIPTAASAAFAITTSTFGASSPRSVALISAPRRRISAHVGNAHEGIGFARRAYLIGIDFAAPGGALGVSSGVVDYACKDRTEPSRRDGGGYACGHLTTVGVHGFRLLRQAGSGHRRGAAFQFGIEAAAGMSFGDYFGYYEVGAPWIIEVRNVSGAFSLPFQLVERLESGVVIAPLLVPGWAYGRSQTTKDRTGEEVTRDGVRFMLAAGLGVLLEQSGLGFEAGVRKVFDTHSPLVLGAGVSLARR